MLSIVAQALLLCLLYTGEEALPLASDANKGCQWEVQTDEGWTPYWNPQA
jgi:hypothetical protein